MIRGGGGVGEGVSVPWSNIYTENKAIYTHNISYLLMPTLFFLLMSSLLFTLLCTCVNLIVSDDLLQDVEHIPIQN